MRFEITIADAEYRGTPRKAGEFTNRQTGEVIPFGDLHKFEWEDADGVLQAVEFAQKACDEAADFDVQKLKRGERVSIELTVGESKNGGGMYVMPRSIRRLSAQVRAAS